MQYECTVTPLCWLFSVQPTADQWWQGKWGKILNIIEKNNHTFYPEPHLSELYLVQYELKHCYVSLLQLVGTVQHLFVYQIDLSINRYIYIFIYLRMYLLIYLVFYLSILQCIHPSVRLYRSINLYQSLSISINLTI